jgi:hypothetical protein
MLRLLPRKGLGLARTLASDLPASISDLVTLSPATASAHGAPRAMIMSLTRPPVNALNTELLEAIAGTIRAVEKDGYAVTRI